MNDDAMRERARVFLEARDELAGPMQVQRLCAFAASEIAAAEERAFREGYAAARAVDATCDEYRRRQREERNG